MKNTEGVFTDIFVNNSWSGKESLSGKGSSLGTTRLIRAALPALFDKYKINSLIDAPCGDYFWMEHLAYKFDSYTGVDIVKDLIDDLSLRKKRDGVRFIWSDITSNRLPAADAVLCRDCLVHLPFALALRALKNFRASNIRYALLTTFPGRKNVDISTGQWRPLDMQAFPFNLPQPLELIREHKINPNDRFNDKHLALWDMECFSIPETEIIVEDH